MRARGIFSRRPSVWDRLPKDCVVILKNRLLMGASCAVALMSLAGAARAQEAQTPETVVVTGSRLGAAGINAPTPVTAVSATDLEKAGPANLGDALNVLPSLTQTGGQQTNIGAHNTGKNILNLRDLGTTRTLVLMDGIRFPSTETSNTVDIDMIPQALVKRVDVVTGGASASYGSDAVAGVINFVLNDHFEGFKAKLSGGTSEYGDNLEAQGSITGGVALLGGRLHLIGSAEYFDSFGVPGTGRAIRRTDPNVVQGPPGSATTNILVPDLRSVTSFGGYVAGAVGGTAAANASVTGLQFNAAGQLVPYNTGMPLTSSYQSGGDGVNTAQQQDIQRPLRRRTAFLRGEYTLSDDLSFYVEGLWGHKDGQQNDGESATSSHAVSVGVDNPFLAPATAAQLKALGIKTLTVSKYFQQDEFHFKEDERETTQLVQTGFNGTLWNRFNWGASGTYSYSREYDIAPGDLNWTNLALAADVTTAPGTGAAICRSTLTSPANGCVPANIFGSYNLSPGAIKYITGDNPVVYDFENEGAEVHIDGPLFDLPAGPVSGALGGEFRRLRDTVISNPLGIAKVFQLGPVAPWQGGYDVTEGFFELGVPLLKDLPLIESLNLNLAGRETAYSTSGDATTWKVGLVYKPISDVTVRGTVSRDIRAPNPSELFTAGSQGSGNVNDPFNGNITVRNITTTSTGNPNLKPEKATTVTAGVVYTPSFVPGLSLTADFYDIQVYGVIASPSTQNIVNFCYQGATAYCSSVIRNGAGTITSVVSSNLNLNSLRTNGVDLEADYAVPAADWFDWWQGDLSLRTFSSYLGLLTTLSPGAQAVYQAGDLKSAAPHWRVVSTASYKLGNWSTFLQMRFIGAGVINRQYNDPTVVPYQTANFNHVNGAFYFDFQETYQLTERFSTYINVHNLFDLPAPLSPTNSTNYSQPIIQPLYDQVGRMFRMGVKYDY